MAGSFIVSRYKDDESEILFQLAPGVEEKGVPEDQLALKAEVEAALVTLKLLFEDDQRTLEHYFQQLLSLAQVGLVGAAAQPAAAKRTLQSLKEEVVSREGGKVKNKYMILLGAHAAGWALVGLLVYAGYSMSGNPDSLIANLALLWVGCMVGVWISYGYRKTTLGFADLAIPEADRLYPSVRLVFAGLLSLFVGFAFYKKVLILNIGDISSQSIASDPIVALIIGTMCGVSELALPSKVVKQAMDALNIK